MLLRKIPIKIQINTSKLYLILYKQFNKNLLEIIK